MGLNPSPNIGGFHMKKILSLLIVLLMVFSLAACGDKGSGNDTGVAMTQDKLKGTWTVDLDMNKFMMATGQASMVGDLNAEYLKDFATDAKLTMYLVFDGNDTMQPMIHADGYVQTTKEFLEDIFEYLKGGVIYDLMEAQGTDRETFDAYLLANDLTADDYIDAMKALILGAMTKDAVLSSIDGEVKGDYLVLDESYYKLEDNKIYTVSDACMEIYYNGTDVTIKAIEQPDENMTELVQSIVPLTMKRVSDQVEY